MSSALDTPQKIADRLNQIIAPPDGYLHMGAANGERCGVPGGTQLTLLPFAVAALIVYSFGYPAFIGYVLW